MRRSPLPLALALLVVVLPAVADDLTYDDLAARPSKYDGKSVRFRTAFSRIQPAVNPLFAHRGVTDRTHIEIQTPGRPLREGGGLAILISRKNERLVALAEGFAPGQEILCAGRVRSVTADNGARLYYIEIADAEPVEVAEDRPAGQVDDPPAVVEDEEYADLDPAELAGDPASLDGRRVRLTLPVTGIDPEPPAWALRQIGVEKEAVIALRGRTNFVPLVPRTRADQLAALRGVDPGTKAVFSGTLRTQGRGRLVRIVFVIDRIERPR